MTLSTEGHKKQMKEVKRNEKTGRWK